ncbi:MAG: ATP-dependent endonuclease [Mesorhizobium sp.]|uniref:AAA family ATPase n=1 Tax=Mesorhizobium sp. TaxID=1871066 RepID=UPI0011F96EC4|nr:AAA family ATPase [Mesorhizobium sp.]TIT21369.1 MAG: ATP-dependent endonuclease [Mesorhizobium sp.]
MQIEHLEIANFRKLLAVRIDLADETTLFVGANNSGKTSAMLALRRFLTARGRTFQTHDITLCHWAGINAIGHAWLEGRPAFDPPDLSVEVWAPFMPSLDLWLKVAPNELHHVSKLVPTLDWAGGILGVRLRLEPKDPEALHKEFLQAIADTETMKEAVKKQTEEEVSLSGLSRDSQKLTLWPSSMMDFLGRRLDHQFSVKAYSLDPAKLADPIKSVARPQELAPGIPPVEGDPLAGLIRVNEINAQRGFGEMNVTDPDDEAVGQSGGHRLSDQLRAYYKKHLDPSDRPDPSDLGALQAIEAAQDAFDRRLTESFKAAFEEVERMGYPGVTDPKPHVSTKLRAVDGLNHQAAVSFQIDVVMAKGEVVPVLRLPEDNNGLGYQNLISMIFRLMSFRDAWMRVGKAAKSMEATDFEPLHLVLVEEPEAHLHAQVQQVFIKKAYQVLRAHEDLKEKPLLRTQLVVSTHSSHVAHETSYACLRYFRRLPAGMENVNVPVSVVINLTKAFGEESETSRFVTRYLRSHHADLFFADAAILVEGAAERMLLPNFIKWHYPRINQGYISLLEVGGSHAHKLQSLINLLGLTTLIITDLDAQKGIAIQPKLGDGQTTNNDTLKSWWPKKLTVDELLDPSVPKVLKHDQLYEVRVAYQLPVEIIWPATATAPQTALPYTFEDALVFQNLQYFSSLAGPGLVKKFRDAIAVHTDVDAMGLAFFTALRTGTKAEFALNILGAEDLKDIAIPTYIAEGLEWLEGQLEKKQIELLSTEVGKSE